MPTHTHTHIHTHIHAHTGFDDLAHFMILFCILVGGYMALGQAQFGWYRSEFKVCRVLIVFELSL